MLLHKGETLFRQGESGALYHLRSGLLKIIRIHEDGHPLLINIIVPDEMIPHHSLITAQPYHGTAIALTACEVEPIPASQWYNSLAEQPDKYREIALLLQNKLRMMQQRIDQLTQTAAADRLAMLSKWFEHYISPASLTDLLTQDEIGQLIGLRRETVNRLLKAAGEHSPSAFPAQH
ncbi:Crp/Fnr family transcriptional regulator [Paenibacillaceae bacterium]|nr:Crp/Fnr family transcriptional regulator [Paenibacillaceae bacterium]